MEMAVSSYSPVVGYIPNPTMVDYPGHLAVIMFTSGCNFRCGFCHNACSLGTKQKGFSWEKLGEACRRFKQQWITGVVVSGGEPTLAENLLELLEFLSSYGFSVKLDSNGSNPDLLRQALPYIDYVAMDIKCSLDSYSKFVAYNRIDRIQESIDILKSDMANFEFRTTVVENFHTDEEVAKMGELVKGAPRYVLQPFVPRDDLPDVALRKQPRTRPQRMREIHSMVNGCAEEVVVRGT